MLPARHCGCSPRHAARVGLPNVPSANRASQSRTKAGALLPDGQPVAQFWPPQQGTARSQDSRREVRNRNPVGQLGSAGQKPQSGSHLTAGASRLVAKRVLFAPLRHAQCLRDTGRLRWHDFCPLCDKRHVPTASTTSSIGHLRAVRRKAEAAPRVTAARLAKRLERPLPRFIKHCLRDAKEPEAGSFSNANDGQGALAAAPSGV